MISTAGFVNKMSKNPRNIWKCAQKPIISDWEGFCRRMNSKIAAVALRVPQPVAIIDQAPQICIAVT